MKFEYQQDKYKNVEKLIEDDSNNL